MATLDDLRDSVNALKGFSDSISEALGNVSVTLGKAANQLSTLLAQLAEIELPEPDQPDITFANDAITDSTAKVVWYVDPDPDPDIHGWRVGRDGMDVKGSGPWSTVLPASTMFFVFSSLKPNTDYNLTLEPVLSSGVGKGLTLRITTKLPLTPPVDPPPNSSEHGPMALAGKWVEKARDDFNGTAVDQTKWGIYNSSGHGGKGLRRPEAFSVVDDATALGGRCLRVYGDTNGKTGGMANKNSQRFGRWGVRMRFPKGDKHYHPVLLTWPSAENWPLGGEIDFAEGNASSNVMQFFLHYSKGNKQTSDDITVDTTKWHWYEMEWTPNWVRGWCDGQLFFEDTDKSHFNYDGFGAHHGTIQLDWFPDGSETTGTAEMFVDAYRVYSA